MTIEVNATLANVHADSLSQALRAALPAKCFGISTYGDPTRPISIWLADSVTGGDQTTATNTAAAHDPVFLAIDKTSIIANGTDTATITVNAPKQGASAVTITVTVTSPGGTTSSVDDSITLTGGVGTETITALDPCTITVVVKNAANRSTDTLTIVAR